jgi:iron(III) transport system ATP-binding protein
MIRVRDLWMTYRTTSAAHAAVRGISIDVAEGQFYTLLGPSGCGKTTTLRCVAGLERPDRGEIAIGGEVVYSSSRHVWVPPYKRNIGMVFQSYAIWPHMSVFDNVAFPLRHKTPRPSRAAVRDAVSKALALVRLDGLEDRPAPYLSGGQQQRLALARALVAEPRVLLLDEPLSNLDAKLREEMRLELREVVERLKVTTLFVTHEQVEALTLSDSIGVMREGIIVQEGAPRDIYRRPTGSFVADFIGKTNILTGKVVARDRVETALGTLCCNVDAAIADGEAVKVAVRPENIVLTDRPPGDDPNVTAGRVETVVYLGNMIECAVAVGNARLRVQLHPTVVIERGTEIRLHLPPQHCLAMRE